jgi:hypothetical protein
MPACPWATSAGTALRQAKQYAHAYLTSLSLLVRASNVDHPRGVQAFCLGVSSDLIRGWCVPRCPSGMIRNDTAYVQGERQTSAIRCP